MLFKITVSLITDHDLLDPDDRASDPTGEYEYDAANEDEALDMFHEDVPISCLDNYEITCICINNSSRFIKED